MEDRDFVNSKISEIEELLENAEIIDESKKTKKDIVGYGSDVVLKIE